MEGKGVGYGHEFEELIGEISQSIQKNDPVTIGFMLYQIAEERRKTNLIIRDLNAKFDLLVEKIDNIEGRTSNHETGLSERDQEVLDYVRRKDRISAEELQKKFKYKGKNAASARLSKLFHDGKLEKEYAGRKVYYKLR
ncbi:MAG: hypothetical protein GF416_04025 [Candidatus Altiarchaeales archaeon]|nr:hypothetical protein [Candidatus Altiarchaeales archaeon]MBD3416287.1 hypothetical protein [Candidatus Altiarchaeales archaeon]